MSKLDKTVIDHERLLDVIDRCSFMGLPRTYYLGEPAELSSCRRTLVVGKVEIVASYLVREDNLAFWMNGQEGREEPPIFWSDRRPDWIETSEDLAEFAAARLIEHLTEQDYHKEE